MQGKIALHQSLMRGISMKVRRYTARVEFNIALTDDIEMVTEDLTVALEKLRSQEFPIKSEVLWVETYLTNTDHQE
jgi:hypothetical protein